MMLGPKAPSQPLPEPPHQRLQLLRQLLMQRHLQKSHQRRQQRRHLRLRKKQRQRHSRRNLPRLPKKGKKDPKKKETKTDPTAKSKGMKRPAASGGSGGAKKKPAASDGTPKVTKCTYTTGGREGIIGIKRDGSQLVTVQALNFQGIHWTRKRYLEHVFNSRCFLSIFCSANHHILRSSPVRVFLLNSRPRLQWHDCIHYHLLCDFHNHRL